MIRSACLAGHIYRRLNVNLKRRVLSDFHVEAGTLNIIKSLKCIHFIFKQAVLEIVNERRFASAPLPDDYNLLPFEPRFDEGDPRRRDPLNDRDTNF